MKELLVKVLVFGVCVLGIWGLAKSLQAMEDRQYQHAIEKCGSVENVVAHTTQEGDNYWTCLVEKK